MVTTILLVILFLVILVLGHELGHFSMAKLFGIRVDEFGFGFPPKLWGKKIGETEYTVNALPLGGFVRIYGENGDDVGGMPKTDEDRKRNFAYAAAWKRVLILIGGVTMNFVIAWIAFSAIFMIGAPTAVYIEKIAANSPAAAAKLQIGDEIVGFSTVDDFVAYVGEHKGQTIDFKIRRGGREMTIPVLARADAPQGEGATGVEIMNGGFESQGFFGGLKEGLLTTGRMSAMIFQLFGPLLHGIFTGNFSVANSVGGPVAIFQAVGNASRTGLVDLVQLLGLISVNLAVLNIMPFPALDGGRLVFIALEPFINKKRLEKIAAAVNTVGFFILIGLLILVTVKDVYAMYK